MKYTPPATGMYESGFTAEFAYTAVSRLFTQHKIVGDKTKIDEHTSGMDKLWKTPPADAELDELVRTYLFGGLEDKLPGFADVFKGEGSLSEKLGIYRAGLEQSYGEEKARIRIGRARIEINRRFAHMSTETQRIPDLRTGRKEWILVNASDAFSTIGKPYFREVMGGL